MGLSSFIHALRDMKQYAVARFVPKANKHAQLLLLAPMIEDGYECLVDAELPFDDDVRTFKFPPLDRVISIAGKQLLKHRTLPDDKLQAAMDEWVDAMDLSAAGKDDHG
jgi:ATP-dependent DNA helicase 2 subunit 2